tara:strand:- start:402 stop:1031 length:630 start_codon:yes stop_codon:yes gene_type:complete
MAITHSTVATSADEDGAEVNKSEWNDDHVIADSTLSIAKTTGLQTALDTKQATITDGSLTIARTTGLQTALDAKETVVNVALKSPIASPTFTGTVTTASLDVAGNNIDNVQNLIHDTSTTTTALNFDLDQLQIISIAASTTFTTTNKAIGKSKTIKITTDATLRTLTFPAWKFIGAKPADQAASKIGILTITCFGSADTDIVAAYAVEE